VVSQPETFEYIAATRLLDGGHIFKCSVGCMQLPRAKHEMGAQFLNEGAGITSPFAGDAPKIWRLAFYQL